MEITATVSSMLTRRVRNAVQVSQNPYIEPTYCRCSWPPLLQQLTAGSSSVRQEELEKIRIEDVMHYVPGCNISNLSMENLIEGAKQQQPAWLFVLSQLCQASTACRQSIAVSPELLQGFAVNLSHGFNPWWCVRDGLVALLKDPCSRQAVLANQQMRAAMQSMLAVKGRYCMDLIEQLLLEPDARPWLRSEVALAAMGVWLSKHSSSGGSSSDLVSCLTASYHFLCGFLLPEGADRKPAAAEEEALQKVALDFILPRVSEGAPEAMEALSRSMLAAPHLLTQLVHYPAFQEAFLQGFERSCSTSHVESLVPMTKLLLASLDYTSQPGSSFAKALAESAGIYTFTCTASGGRAVAADARFLSTVLQRVVEGVSTSVDIAMNLLDRSQTREQVLEHQGLLPVLLQRIRSGDTLAAKIMLRMLLGIGDDEVEKRLLQIPGMLVALIEGLGSASDGMAETCATLLQWGFSIPECREDLLSNTDIMGVVIAGVSRDAEACADVLTTALMSESEQQYVLGRADVVATMLAAVAAHDPATTGTDRGWCWVRVMGVLLGTEPMSSYLATHEQAMRVLTASIGKGTSAWGNTLRHSMQREEVAAYLLQHQELLSAVVKGYLACPDSQSWQGALKGLIRGTSPEEKQDIGTAVLADAEVFSSLLQFLGDPPQAVAQPYGWARPVCYLAEKLVLCLDADAAVPLLVNKLADDDNVMGQGAARALQCIQRQAGGGVWDELQKRLREHREMKCLEDVRLGLVQAALGLATEHKACRAAKRRRCT